MKKITVIIFTYKRAMLLHNCLDTLIDNFKNLDKTIHIIYNPDVDIMYVAFGISL